MAYKTISAADVAQYPSMKDKLGKTVTASEFRILQRNDSAAVKAPAKVAAPRKVAAKKAVAKKATAKKAAPRKR